MKRILGFISIIGCFTLPACCNLLFHTSDSIEVSGEQYVTGFYDAGFWYIEQEAIVWNQQNEIEDCREVKGMFDSYTMLGESHLTNGILYVRAKDKEAAQNYYSDYDNFVYKCQIGYEMLDGPEPEVVILENVSYEKFRELQNFAERYENKINRKDSSNDTLEIPFGESREYEKVTFWAESPDGVFSSSTYHEFYIKNNQM